MKKNWYEYVYTSTRKTKNLLVLVCRSTRTPRTPYAMVLISVYATVCTQPYTSIDSHIPPLIWLRIFIRMSRKPFLTVIAHEAYHLAYPTHAYILYTLLPLVLHATVVQNTSHINSCMLACFHNLRLSLDKVLCWSTSTNTTVQDNTINCLLERTDWTLQSCVLQGKYSSVPGVFTRVLPVPDTSVGAVRHSCPYPTRFRVLYDYHTRTQNFCVFCTLREQYLGYGYHISYTLTRYSVSSVQHTYPTSWASQKADEGSQGQLLRNWTCTPSKKYLWVPSNQLLPRKCWKLVFLASEWVGAFSKIYPKPLPDSSGAQLHEITVSLFAIQLGQIRLQSPIGSKSTFSIQLGQVRLQWSNGSNKTFSSIRSGIVIVFDPGGPKKGWRWFSVSGP